MFMKTESDIPIFVRVDPDGIEVFDALQDLVLMLQMSGFTERILHILREVEAR